MEITLSLMYLSINPSLSFCLNSASDSHTSLPGSLY
jgi:hypothetical protein